MKTFAALGFVLALGVSAASAQTTPDWIRYPAISPDGTTIVFTYKGDLYRVPAAGGAAVPLTVHEAHDFMPVWSHDGKQIAFASNRHGNFDVYVMPAGGGEARRLTFHSADEFPYAFDRGDKTVLFGAARLDAASQPRLPHRGAARAVPGAGRGRAGAAGAHHAGPGRRREPRRHALPVHGPEGLRERLAQAPHVVDHARHLALRQRVGHAPQDHDVRRRGPQPGLRRPRHRVLLPERGRRLVQRAQDEPRRGPVHPDHLVHEGPGPVPEHLRGRHAVLRLRRRGVHEEGRRRAPQGGGDGGGRRQEQQQPGAAGHRRRPRDGRVADRQGSGVHPPR